MPDLSSSKLLRYAPTIGFHQMRSRGLKIGVGKLSGHSTQDDRGFEETSARKLVSPLPCIKFTVSPAGPEKFLKKRLTCFALAHMLRRTNAA
jgi:hypothetical protein